MPRRGRIILTPLPALALIGCMVGPNFTTPEANVANHYQNATTLQAGPVNDAIWWENFHDPTLNNLIQAGYKNNLSLQIAGVRVLQARAELAAAVGQLYPQQQGAFGSYTYERQSKAAPTNIAGTATYLNVAQLGFTADWELDFWGKFRRAIQANDASFLGSIDAYDAALVTLTSDIATSYIAIRTLQAQIQVAQSNIVVQTESLRIANAQFHAGQTNLLDVEQAQTQLGTTEATLPTLRAQLGVQQDALAILLGITPDKVAPLLAGSTAIPQAPSGAVVGIPKDLLRQRPDVKEAELAAASQSALIGVAQAQLYPALSLSGTFGWESSTSHRASLGDLFNWSSRAITLGPSVQIPLFNYGQITNQVRAQDAAFEQSILNYQNIVLQAQQQVQDAITNYVQAQQAVAALNAAVQSAVQATNLAMIRYVDGATDYTTVLTVEQAQLQVQNSLAVAEGNVPQALVALYTGLGGGWQIAEGHDVVPDRIKTDMARRTNWGGLLAPAHHAAPTTRAQQIKQTYVPNW
ncbi:MAG TPA: efflux transporter outer membrane subunit [Acidocella sp.]|jgi:NodT family efflux transporter outer membrane factor (OMF) lipoprotein|nr:efflux transporter outer membrane subunit [Acidocella sp.]